MEHSVAKHTPLSLVDKKKKIFSERAKKLAELTEKTNTDLTLIEVVKFRLAHEVYAIETQYIREVTHLKDLTLIPCVPPFVCGLIHVRRKILSVIDLKFFFNLPVNSKDSEKKLIILEKGEMEFALLTDGIVEVSSLVLEELQASLPTLTGVRQEFLKGLTSDGIVVLDGNKLLNSQQIIVDDAVTSM